MPAARRRTVRNKLTGVAGTTRRAVNEARFGGETTERADARRAKVYSAPPEAYAPEAKRPYRTEITDQERKALTERIRILYVERGTSILDIECDTGRSSTLIRGIIADNEFVKGKKVK